MSQSTATVMSLLVNYVLSLMGIFRHGKVLIHVHSLTCPYMYLAIDRNGMLNRKTNLKHIKMNFMNCFSLLMFTFGNFKEIKWIWNAGTCQSTQSACINVETKFTLTLAQIILKGQFDFLNKSKHIISFFQGNGDLLQILKDGVH